ncbi:MAG: undecaprenyl-diphosphate phosphatase [Buchnera aphidicola (Nurudea shiraii)]
MYTTTIYHIFITIFLGIIGGILEFFPISSTSHIIIFSKFFKIEVHEVKMLNSFIQFGTSLSILLYFKNTFIELFYSFFKKNDNYNSRSNLSYLHVVISTIPIVLIELFLHKHIQQLFNLKNIFFPLIFGSTLLILSEIFKKNTKNKNKNISLLQSCVIGCFQCLALWPGVSRSCSTISIGILIGLSQLQATYFSFIISVPISFGAIILDLYNNLQIITLHNITFFLIGWLSSFITSAIFIKKCLKKISVCSFIPFIIYRISLSCIITFLNF